MDNILQAFITLEYCLWGDVFITTPFVDFLVYHAVENVL